MNRDIYIYIYYIYNTIDRFIDESMTVIRYMIVISYNHIYQNPYYHLCYNVNSQYDIMIIYIIIYVLLLLSP